MRALMFLAVLLVAGSASAELAKVTNIGLKASDAGLQIDLSVTNPGKRVCHDVEVLIRLGRAPVGADSTDLDDQIAGKDTRQPTEWIQLALKNEAADKRVVLHSTEQSPAVGQTVLVLQRTERLFVRYRFT